MTDSVVDLDDRISAVKEQYGEEIPIDTVGEVVSSLVSGTSQAGDIQHIAGELKELLDFITAARDELGSMRPKSLSAVDIPRAADELSAVVENTEAAAGTVMDAADTLSEIAFSMEGDQADTLMKLSTDLFEASSFQDITGQRINKVASTLDHLEDKLIALAEAIGDDYVETVEEEVFDEGGDVVNDEALLHGPQLDGEGNSQADIDALLASFD
ncbi:protein phosphatase CheZ [Temperatibacter marinus]|uniref:Protein phosphatase CheZ n=1 Tax=Temperatibacter marinus TaxID=1456591 RepID=A0AA52EFQ0_9PROT|nr:protein phosphatase CheZ [Temperatibacter marinus]WND01684.1 protein phosphatase CheZ [Temperatibacter marinus]